MIRKRIKNRAMEESGWGSMNSLTSNILIWLYEKSCMRDDHWGYVVPISVHVRSVFKKNFEGQPP